MATLVLSTIGAVVGGPIGSAVGAFLGGQVDAAIFGGGSREGPRLRELSVTTSSYGQPIARHFGRMRVAGTVIWSTDLIETTSKEGGGKGRPSTKTYSYSASFAVALSSTPVGGIGRIWADGNLLRGAGGDLKVEGEMRAYLGTGDHPVDSLISASIGAAAPAFRDIAYVIFEGLQLGDFGNRIPALTFELFGLRDDTVSLDDLVPQTGGDAGGVVLPHARGFSDEGGALVGSLSVLENVFPLTCATTQEGLRFAASDNLPVEIPVLSERFLESEDEALEGERKQRGGSSGREPLALRYYDEDRDYQPSVQRALGMRQSGRETVVDIPAAMQAAGARSVANANANRARWLDEKMIWRTGEFDPRIRPGSVVRAPGHAGYWLVRSWEWFDRGIELAIERLSPSASNADAGDAGLANRPVDTIPSPTTLRAIEVPPDGTTPPSLPILYAAASSAEPGWRGASLFVELGGTLDRLGGTLPNRALIGELVEPLGSSSSMLLSPNEELEIDMIGDDLTPSSTDVTGMAMGANRILVGGEVMQFLEASSLGANRWRLRGLLRGRAGTEDQAIVGHPAGTSVVFLDDRLTPLDAAVVPSDPSTRIAAIGRGDNTLVYSALANAGLSRRPMMPIGAQATRDVSGNWVFKWVRRGRGQWRWNDGSDVPLIEEQEGYLVGYGPIDAPYTGWSVNEPIFAISHSAMSNLLAEYGQNPLWVRQVGTYGQSAPLLIATLS